MDQEIVKFIPTHDIDYNSPAFVICVSHDQYYVETTSKDGSIGNTLKCQSFAHALMHAAMLLIYNPTVQYTVERN